MNKVIIMGRLTRDPEVKYSQGEKPMAIAKYTLAVDRKFKKDGEPTADFINCTAFGKSGEFTEKYFHQGMRVLVTGRIQTGNYTNKDGVKVYTTDIMVEDQEFADSKGANSGDGSTCHQTSRPTPQNASNDGFMNIPEGVEDEGLPFN